MQSTKKKLWSLTTGKVKKYLLVLGAVLACSAPFIHMLFPKTNAKVVELRIDLDNGLITQESYDEKTAVLIQDARTFGFPNARKFWYAIGKPLLLLYVSFYLIFLYPLISDKVLKESTKIFSSLLCFVAFYFVVWTFWYRGDLPKPLYYAAIGIASIAGAGIANLTINYKYGLKLKIQLLIKFISVDAYDKYVKEEDREEYMDDSYTVYKEITK